MAGKLSREGKTRASLGIKLENKLMAYAVSATAAGVGILALAQPANANVIVTPTHQTILPNQKLSLDLNHDGIPDFSLEVTNIHRGNVYQTGPERSLGGIGLTGSLASNQPVQSLLGDAAVLGSQVSVGGSKNFGGLGDMAGCLIYYSGNGTWSGPWVPQKDKFLGVKFSVGGQTHYGWVRVSTKRMSGLRRCEAEALVTAYAYETNPDTPILTGKPGTSEVRMLAPDLDQPSAKPTPSLGLLAQGAPGLDVWRRE